MFGTYQRLRVSVYASNREVIKAASRKLTKQAMRSEYRKPRHEFYRQMLGHHVKARDLASFVARGL